VLSVPRAGPAPATSIPQISSQYEPQDNYTTDTLADSVALISTEDTAAAQLENFPQPQAHVSTRNDKTDPERFDKSEVE
jgi:hypothetical protein